MKKIVNDANVDVSIHCANPEDKNESGSISPLSFGNPEPCLDRLTENKSAHKLTDTPSDSPQSISKQGSTEASEESECPKISIDKLSLKDCTEFDDKTDAVDEFHDAIESVNEGVSRTSTSSVELSTLQPEIGVSPPTSTKDDVNNGATSLPKLEEQQTAIETISPVEATDEAEDSFHEKANEEVMEKDLPDKKEID